MNQSRRRSVTINFTFLLSQKKVNVMLLEERYFMDFPHLIFSKNTKDFHCSIDQNGFEVDSTFYEE